MISKKRVVFLLLALFFVSALNAAVTYDSISPVKKTEREDKLAVVVINVSPVGSEIYINNNYQGKSDLKITNLTSGNYKLKVEKEGYDTGYFKIQAKQGYTYTYSITLKRTTGYIDVKGLPSGGLVYVDGFRKSSFPAEVDMGNHTVKVRLFGYKDYVKDVYVPGHKTQTVNPVFVPAPFEISDFSASKKKINPEYSNGFGRCEFSFEVTADGKADVYVCDESDNIVWYNRYQSFSTWSQSCIWKGTNNSGSPVPSGTYTAVLTDYGEFRKEVEIVVDRDMSYPLVNYTKAGSGIGNAVMAFPIDGSFRVPFISVQPTFNASAGKYADTGASVGFFADFAGCIELGISGNVYFPMEIDVQTQLSVNANIKYTYATPVSETATLGIALIGRYGFSGDQSVFPEGIDNGCGLGGGLAVGFDSNSCYFGLDSEYVFGSETGILTEDCRVWKNSAVLNYKISRTCTLGLWASLHSKFNASGVDFLNGKEAGVDFSFMPGSSATILNFKAGVLMTNDSRILAGGQFGLSYLF